MDLRQIRSFVTLAEQLHFGRAARVLNLSQPALTKQIRRLEEEVGGALLTRSRHGTQLSALGEQFLRGARGSLRDFDELLDRTRRAASGQTGRLRIGFGFHTFELHLTGVLADFLHAAGERGGTGAIRNGGR